jgi:DNA-binding Lrp family transcriptional regulator
MDRSIQSRSKEKRALPVDRLDIRILRELVADVSRRSLQSDIRKSYAIVAQKLGTTENTVRNRIDSLYAAGMILGWRLGINPTVFGYQTSFLFFDVSLAGEKEDVLRKFRAIPGVLWIVDYFGNTAGVLIAHKDDKSLAKVLEPVRSILDSKVYTRVNNWFPEVNIHLTETDWEIIKSLRKNPRKPYTDLAGELGISVRTARRRLRRLTRNNVLFIFPAVNLKKLEGAVPTALAVFYSDSNVKSEVERRIMSKFGEFYLFTPSPEAMYGAYIFILPNLATADEMRVWTNSSPGVINASVRPLVDFINLLDESFEFRAKG